MGAGGSDHAARFALVRLDHLDANCWHVAARGLPVQPSVCADARPGQP
jgi:hypothetical protein